MTKLSAKDAAGFTLIELVVVIVLLGVLAALVLPRFVEVDVFRSRAAYDEVAGAIRYAQKLAVASGCEVRFLVSGSQYFLQQCSTGCTDGSTTSCASSDFATLTDHPITDGRVTGISFSATPASFVFDAMGRSSSGATISIGADSFTLIAETGYVDAQ